MAEQWLGKALPKFKLPVTDDTGKICHVWRKVRPEETVTEAATAIKQLAK